MRGPPALSALPDIVEAAYERAERSGFTISCEPEVGRLLAVLAAGVPSGGRIAELGTGAGVGTAWMVWGLGPRTDVELVTVENDPDVAAVTLAVTWPDHVRLVEGDALEEIARSGPYDLLFPDAPAGKWWGFDDAVAALRPGGTLIMDDLVAAHDPGAEYHDQLAKARDRALAHPDLLCVELRWSSGVILAVKR